MRSEYQIWQAELSGEKPSYSGWWIVGIGLVLVIGAMWGLKL